MTPAAAREAADLLWRMWEAHETIPELPVGCRPATIDDAWAIQRALDAHAGRAVGWKIAATSPAGQRHIGADGPVAARLYERCLVTGGSRLDAEALTMRSAEPEFAFRMATDLELSPEPFSRAAVLAAVGALHLAIEVPDTRFSDFTSVGLPSLVADAMCAAFLVVGDAVTSWDARALPGAAVAVRRNGEPVAAGCGADVMGDPCVALVWLANALRERGEMLRAGDIVTTGASAPPVAIGPGDHFAADFGALGALDVSFARAAAA